MAPVAEAQTQPQAAPRTHGRAGASLRGAIGKGSEHQGRLGKARRAPEGCHARLVTEDPWRLRTSLDVHHESSASK